MTDYWIQVDQPDATTHLWHVGEVDDETRDHALAVVNTAQGVPADWIEHYLVADGPTWCVSLLAGEPHPTLVERATVRAFADLEVTPKQVEDHHAEAAARTVEVQLASARAALAALPPELRALLSAEVA